MIWKLLFNILQIFDISCNLDCSECRYLYNICIISSIITSYLTISQPILHLCPHNTTTIILWQTSTIKNSRNTSGSWWISPGKEWGMWVSAMWLWMSAVMRWGPRRGSVRSWPLSVRRRHAAVCAGLDDWPMTGLKFHNTSLQLFDFLFLPCNATAETAVNTAQGKSVLGTKSKISRANLFMRLNY